MKNSRVNYNIHPLSEMFPEISGQDFEKLVASIRKHGLLEPIVVKNGTTIIDGRNRFRACQEAGVTPHFEEYRLETAVRDYIWAKNVDRRHLTDDQKAAVVLKWEEQERDDAKKRIEVARHRLAPPDSAEPKPGGDTRQRLAARANVSRYKIEQAQTVKHSDEKHGTQLLSTVAKGEMDLKAAVRKMAIDKLRMDRAKSPRRSRPAAEADIRREAAIIKLVHSAWRLEDSVKRMRSHIEGAVAGAPGRHRVAFKQRIREIVDTLNVEEKGGSENHE